jgi:hypothetical protein
VSVASELAANKRQTLAFIAANPFSVALIPHTKARTPSGGQGWTAQAPRAQQVVRIVDQSSGGGPAQGPQSNGDGRAPSVDQVLVARWDALLGVNDRFAYGGRECVITRLFPDNGYERRAVVTAHGE